MPSGSRSDSLVTILFLAGTGVAVAGVFALGSSRLLGVALIVAGIVAAIVPCLLAGGKAGAKPADPAGRPDDAGAPPA